MIEKPVNPLLAGLLLMVLGLSVWQLMLIAPRAHVEREARVVQFSTGKDRIICRGLDGTDQAGWTRLHKADFYMLADPRRSGSFSYQEAPTLECHIEGSPGKTFVALEGWWRTK